MGRGDRPPDSLIEAIARHAAMILDNIEIPPRDTRRRDAARLLRREVDRLVTYKRGKR